MTNSVSPSATRTLLLIKPHALRAGHADQILGRAEAAGLQVCECIVLSLQPSSRVPKQALPGGGSSGQLTRQQSTIRGDFGTALPDNAAHGSASDEEAEREILLLLPWL